jgi:outer membrane receptor for ferrienterochelin and colicins
VSLAFVTRAAAVPLSQAASIHVVVRSGGQPVAGASVVARGDTHRTDARGAVLLSVPAGALDIVVVKERFEPQTITLQAQADQTQQVVVDLVAQGAIEEEITVAATRTNKRLDDQPMRVEVLGREEIEEKLLMTPGDIVMMLNEMGGMRVQATSPSLGAASIRIQGMRGRYTRLLSDGLPLFGEQVGGLGLLQIPPMDLGQVEVI